MHGAQSQAAAAAFYSRLFLKEKLQMLILLTAKNFSQAQQKLFISVLCNRK